MKNTNNPQVFAPTKKLNDFTLVFFELEKFEKIIKDILLAL